MASFHRAYVYLGLVLVFLGPIFFYFTIDFLRKVDYFAATLAFLAGWLLLRSGIDLTRAILAVEVLKQKSAFEESEDRQAIKKAKNMIHTNP